MILRHRSISPALAEEIPMSMSDHGAVHHDVSPAITAMMRDAAVPGLSLAVVRDDRLLYGDAFGWADLATRTPATTTTSYLWFSMSKIATATAAMRLADENRLDLDAPLDEYVGYLHAPGDTQPTTRQLLTHTAGLANPLPIRWVHRADSPGPDPEVLLRELAGRRRAFRYPIGGPGRYSNVGYLAAAQVIAAVAGRPFQDYVHDAVLVPAGMTATGFTYQPGAQAASGYVRAPRGTGPALRALLPKGIVGQRHGRYLGLRPFLIDGAGYGGLVGHVLDAARFLRLHLGDGQIDGQRILSAQTARAMRRIVAHGKPFDHATGWFRRPVADTTEQYVEHFGAGAGFWNVMRLYPERNLGIVVMTNSTTSYRFDPLFRFLIGASWPS
jgi:CubicO group peptidase (beta-lactamase class C family)